MRNTRIFTCHGSSKDIERAIFDATIEANQFLQRHENEELDVTDFSTQTYQSNGIFYHIISLIYRRKSDTPAA